MNSTREKSAKDLGLIYCDKCGYCNRKEMVDKFGTCRGCGKVLDDKAKFIFEMNSRLRLWKNNQNLRKNFLIEVNKK